MTKILSILSVFLVLACSNRQASDKKALVDSASACVESTIAAMPASNAQTLDSLMAELSLYAPDCVVMLSEAMKPADQGAGAKLEFALSGLSRYASVNPKVKKDVEEGFKQAILLQQDSVNKAFLEAELRLLGPAPKAAKIKNPSAMKAEQVLKAMSLPDRKSRMQALDLAPAGDRFYRKLVSCPKAEGADADILYFLGERKSAVAIDYIIGQIGGPWSEDAQKAAARIGGKKAAKALCAIASPALLYFNGSFGEELSGAYAAAEPELKPAILEIAAERHITSFFPAVLEQGRYDLLAVFAKNSPDMLPALKENFEKSSHPQLFYPAIAATDCAEAVEILAGEYKNGKPAALDALASMTVPEVADILLEASVDSDRYLGCFVSIMEASRAAGTAGDDSQVLAKYVKALGLARSDGPKAAIFGALQTLRTPEVLDVVEPCLYDKSLCREAALCAARTIVRYASQIDPSRLEKCSSRVKKILLSTGYADDAYAVDEINLALEKSNQL